MEQEDIVAQNEEMLNKLTRAELLALNRAMIPRVSGEFPPPFLQNYPEKFHSVI
jgi:hypothetical protein